MMTVSGIFSGIYMRKEPYTDRGISRVPCCKCGAPSVHQWQCCATGNLWMGLCITCDIELNRLTLKFIGHPDAQALMAKYEEQAA